MLNEFAALYREALSGNGGCKKSPRKLVHESGGQAMRACAVSLSTLAVPSFFFVFLLVWLI